MPIHKSTEYGDIEISLDAIANLVGGTINECYGIVGMASQKVVKDGWAELLKRENYSRGVIVRQDGNSLILDIYVIALQGIKLSEVMVAAQQRVRYVLEKTLEVKVEAVNLNVQGVRTVK
ncbi:Asp23/Gls24 family envelope stress response protein [Erysipelotrichaceae bacterium 51-3]|uniref:Asp23/Gls24 family envelope stress response protein n=1 Tax=Allobaculum sp. JKK-2023 TaxID=3108943 RepID=UPI002B055A5B|nr:Asp23/Gls24 family envelope stress response protein [Allobaculum sp. JKK-2023]